MRYYWLSPICTRLWGVFFLLYLWTDIFNPTLLVSKFYGNKSITIHMLMSSDCNSWCFLLFCHCVCYINCMLCQLSLFLLCQLFCYVYCQWACYMRMLHQQSLCYVYCPRHCMLTVTVIVFSNVNLYVISTFITWTVTVWRQLSLYVQVVLKAGMEAQSILNSFKPF